MKNCIAAANSTTYISEHIIKLTQKETNETLAFKQILTEFPNSLSELLSYILDIILSEDSQYMWTLSKPLLGLLIINESDFENIKNFAIMKITNNSVVQARLNDGLSKLMTGVNRSMDARNRDRFAKNFNELRAVLNSIN